MRMLCGLVGIRVSSEVVTLRGVLEMTRRFVTSCGCQWPVDSSTFIIVLVIIMSWKEGPSVTLTGYLVL